MTAQDCRRCRVVSLVLAAAIGALFGAGLLVAGMTQPARVVGFLNPLGDWDPTLAWVMAGAVAVYAVAFRQIYRRRIEPWFEQRFQLPTRREIDRELVIGAALFGIGWGLAGLCPGPAIVSAGGLSASSLVFVIAMIAGMWIHALTSARRARR